MKKIKTYPLEVLINGEWNATEAAAQETLLHALREKFGHTEVKSGCAKGDCGVCTILLDGEPVNACLTLALQAHKRKLVTVRGLGTLEKPHPLQESFVKHGAIQCGFCTSGMILTAKGLLDKNPKPTREEIKEAISGNLCRCTGYKKIIEAIQDASQKIKR